MARKYHILVTRDDATSPWYPQFGDYDKDVVKQEVIDCYRSFKASNRRIITTENARQSTINEAIALLNRP